MGRRRDHRNGRPTLLTAAVEERLIAASEGGVPVDIAASIAGISRATFFVWMQRGRDESEARADESYVHDADETPYVDLYERVSRARDQAAATSMLLIRRVAQGGTVTEETTETLPDGTVVKTTKRQPPDWRAGAWYLERQHPKHFGKEPAHVEVTGAGGAAIEHRVELDVEDLTQRIASNVAEITAAERRLEIEAGGQYEDAEVLDPTE